MIKFEPVPGTRPKRERAIKPKPKKKAVRGKASKAKAARKSPTGL
ncbi:hypothetical protein [Mesorhizobium sp. M4A.F.Ca.ET.090.04.2.1]|nr:hypothetical protein [Mesorhizobium sp. M4A.F.Ca.ET.090.04.2.1]